VWLAARLAQELGARRHFALLGAIVTGLATSIWIDVSIAEVHALSLAFTLSTLLLALRFHRSGKPSALLGAMLVFTQGIAHQRAVELLAPSVAVLFWKQRHVVRRYWLHCAAITLLAPLAYLYPAVRMWMGAEWYFGSPNTLESLRAMMGDHRLVWSSDLETWWKRTRTAVRILHNDIPLPVLASGLLGFLSLVSKRRRASVAAMTLAWAPYIILTLLIWENQVSDALLAAKLPVVALAGPGLALALTWLADHWRKQERLVIGGFLVALLLWSAYTRPHIVSITRDDSAWQIISTADRATVLTEGRPTTLMATWGYDYWALAYAQAYEGKLATLTVVDHNADFADIIRREGRLWLVTKTFHVHRPEWWRARLGDLYLSSVAPGVGSVSPTAPLTFEEILPSVAFDLGNGISIRAAEATWVSNRELLITVYWETLQSISQDYSVAMHVLSDAADQVLIAQSDTHHPLEGWYPTSLWHVGEIVRDDHLIEVPAEAQPRAARVSLYYRPSDNESDSKST
jgi:hypothetical protein